MSHIQAGLHAKIQTPPTFLCPLIKAIMVEPVTSIETGLSFEYSAIFSWYAKFGDVCPVTGGSMGKLVPNQELQDKIRLWRFQRQQMQAFWKVERKRKMYQRPDITEKLQDPILPEFAPVDQEKILDSVRAHTTFNLQQHAIQFEGRPMTSLPTLVPQRRSQRSFFPQPVQSPRHGRIIIDG
jgi:U-box domain